MVFRTEVDINAVEEKIQIEDSIFSIGSCFASEISSKLADGQLKTFHNPFGTLFNPFAINKAFQKIYAGKDYTEADLILANDLFMSLDHHSSFDSRYAHKTLEQINSKLQSANDFLQTSKWVIITYGSAFIYEFLPKNKIAANCHKIPQKFFNKRLLSNEELRQNIAESIECIKDICPDDVQILFSLSPVRHTKDGMTENSLSKAKLLTAIHDVIPNYSNCHYLPIYEILMDDLRDYRFYKDDMLHPNSQAVQYVWEKFGNAFFDDETKIFINENSKIQSALQHKSSDEEGPKHQKFLESLKQKIQDQRQKVKHPIFSDLDF